MAMNQNVDPKISDFQTNTDAIKSQKKEDIVKT